MTELTVSVICIILISILLTNIGISIERHLFNKGQCKTCGRKLIHFDTDSMGGRLYRCPECYGNFVCVSYRCVDKDFEEVT